MGTFATFLSVITALAMFVLAAYDFTNPPRVVDLMARLGHRPGFHRSLGILKALGGLGLLVGLAVEPIGVLAAIGLVVYFVLAVGAHARLRDSGAETIPAAGLFVLCALTLLTLVFS